MSYRVITREEPRSSVSEQYRKVRTSIDFSSLDEQVKVINMTSANPGEGKTVTCINVATVYSQAEKKVLLIDMDLRKPKIHRAFDLSNSGGVSGYIVNKNLKSNVQEVNPYLDVMVSGEKVPFPSEALGSNLIKGMMEEIRKEYDIVVIDCPPMTAVTDASIISNFSDGTVFVLASRSTNRDVARNSLKQLENHGANVLGAVLTRVSKQDSAYGMDYYYYYGE